jgi:uncharacterized membrane-anchored protein YhcB (DUF1043 family)
MAIFLDIFLSSIAIFFVTFCWIYYILHNVTTALLLSLIVGLCSSYIVYRIASTNHKKQQLTKNKKAQLDSFANYLCFCENAGDVFVKLLKYYTFVPQHVQNDGIVATKNGQQYYVALLFDNDIVTPSEVRKAVKTAKGHHVDKLIAFCIGYKPTDLQMANSQLPTKFVDKQNALLLFEQADMLPQLNCTTVKKSAYFAQFAFAKKRFGGYFASGMFLLITSALTFFPLYSIVWGTALVRLALYSLLNKKYNVTQSVATLE